MASRAILFFFGGLMLAVLIVAGTIFAVDPFHYYRWSEPPHLASLMQRHSVVGQIRNTQFDTIVLGNSTAARLNQSVFDDAGYHARVANLSMWGATLEENAVVAELALRERKIKRVIWLIGNQQLDGYRSDDFPKCMYDPRWRALPYCYLFNLSVFQEAVELELPFLDYQDKPSWRHDVETWKSYDHIPMKLREYVCDLHNFAKMPRWERRWASSDFTSLDWTETDIFAAYERLVFPLVDAHPDVEFVFVFPPMFQIDLVRFVYQNANFSMFYMSLVEKGLLPRPNVEVYDYRFSPLNRDPAEYLDAAHFSEPVSREMIRMLAAGKYRVTSTPDAVKAMVEGTEEAVRDFRRLYLEYRPCGGQKEILPK